MSRCCPSVCACVADCVAVCVCLGAVRLCVRALLTCVAAPGQHAVTAAECFSRLRRKKFGQWHLIVLRLVQVVPAHGVSTYRSLVTDYPQQVGGRQLGQTQLRDERRKMLSVFINVRLEPRHHRLIDLHLHADRQTVEHSNSDKKSFYSIRFSLPNRFFQFDSPIW